MNTLRIGCAGWSIGREHAAAFPPDGSALERYAARLDAAEINSSFYRSHKPDTYARWADSVPAAFRFSVKLPRTITHDAKLRAIDAPLDQFVAEIAALGDKLGCVLVQLPPSFALDVAGAGDFFTRLRARVPGMLACEARHATWFGDEATDLLHRHRITRVVADPSRGLPPHVDTTPESYLRLHGSPRVYYSSYDEATLAAITETASARGAAGHVSWCIFDNTASGAATANALALRRAMAQRETRP